jgi:hypothetical protein
MKLVPAANRTQKCTSVKLKTSDGNFATLASEGHSCVDCFQLYLNRIQRRTLVNGSRITSEEILNDCQFLNKVCVKPS